MKRTAAMLALIPLGLFASCEDRTSAPNPNTTNPASTTTPTTPPSQTLPTPDRSPRPIGAGTTIRSDPVL